ncbi:MAG: bifunctional proline dehydrogenase/L-glutamate gamma-semialdehyde dehydrogenase PutA [Pseudomonadota bacterium]
MHKTYLDHIYKDETEAVEALLEELDWPEKRADKIKENAADYVRRIRKTRRKQGSLESFFQQYGLNTEEGLALMALAEALLRIPDSKTANALIRDKISGTNWLKNMGEGKDWMTRVAGLGLSATSGAMNSLFSKLGEPVIREAMLKAMRIMGKQFVIGETMTGAMKTAKKLEDKGFRMSYDILGEGARTKKDAQRYFESYLGALHDLAEATDEKSNLPKPGISVKLSALHPRFEFSQKERCVPELTEKLVELARVAGGHNLTLTVDAEEVSRLSLSLDIVEAVCIALQSEKALKKWQGFGLALQAYQKAAPTVIDHIEDLAIRYERTLQVRLVKGAYWDTEIKHAQVGGFKHYSVYTRKSNTDASYLLCAQKLLAADKLYPMFGTHNAHTVSAIIEMAGVVKGYEFQKLYGMGDALYNQVINDHTVLVTSYAPVGNYGDLLPYLVRRMLENGANSSFVNQIYNKVYKPEEIVLDPIEKVRANEVKYHPSIPLPKDLFGDERQNSRGIDLDHERTNQTLISDVERFQNKIYESAPLIGGKFKKENSAQKIISPFDRDSQVGHVVFTHPAQVNLAFDTAKVGHQIWSQMSARSRVDVLSKMASRLEENEAELISLCIREAGKTYDDAHLEVREAVDFCRYYAARGRKEFAGAGVSLPSPTGESNIYKLESRGVFVCISPWNFPLAIYMGQISAALMAGNSVIAKPAEQTSLIAVYLARLFIEAGLPPQALSVLPGDGEIGAELVDHSECAGVAFTGSTQVAKLIQRSLANKEGPIVPLIAETGGQNAMIVDSSALTEQVVDDLILSSFKSAGQRCSACRILFIQDDVADKTLEMLKGAMQELVVGNPSLFSTDIGPIIDMEACANLQKHKSRLEGFGKEIFELPLDNELAKKGSYFAPIAYEIPDLSFLEEEVFGPVLHVVRYKANEVDSLIDQINALGYGLTFGVHSRIERFIAHVSERIKVGNVYVNRGTTGAVVGVQPFGGQGLSGTGPKAGGPRYLHAFACEKVISMDTTAAGGNASLVMIGD